MENPHNIFAKLPIEALGQEIFEEILSSGNVRIERIISTGQNSPEGFWYNQDENEWVILLQGEARIGFRDQPEAFLKPGDYLFLPAHEQHRVTYTSKVPECIWLAVFWLP